jgi:4-hydroxy-tetrahydrodipicolinate synthase
MRLEGSMVAIVTPLERGGVDEKRLRELVAWKIAEGTDGIVPCGTTGEGATLTSAERLQVIRATVEEARGKATVIAGCGSNATHDAIDQVRAAKQAGADAALVVTPYYNKPTQGGLFQHYKAIWDAVKFPVVAYNVPSRTAGDLLPETVARLARAGCIAGIKEATANLDRQIQLLEQVGPDAIAYLSGDVFTVLPYIACGGHGVISVIANIAPRQMKALVTAARAGDLAQARKLQVEMARVNRAMFLESNPGPVKSVLHLMGKIGPEIRLPLVPPAESSLAKIREAVTAYGIPLKS